MGVPGFFSWLKHNKKISNKNLIKKDIRLKIKYLFLDANCLLHPCVNNILEKYKLGKLEIEIKNREQLEEIIWEKIENYIMDMIFRIEPDNLFIAIDGVAPMGKIIQQRQRRYKYLYDKDIKLNKNNNNNKIILQSDGIKLPFIPITSIELTPGTDFMERIHNKFEKFIKKLKINTIYSSYHEEGEGEHKIFQYIKKNLIINDNIVIYGLDADLLFLSLAIGKKFNLYVMRERQVFNNKEVDLDDEIEYNYIDINELHDMIKNLGYSTNDFIIMCYLIGNDFLPNILTLDIKNGGLDKICTAFDNVQKRLNLKKLDKNNLITSFLFMDNNEKNFINLNYLKEIFKELRWTEKYVWNNINREKYNDNEIDNKLNINEIKQKKLYNFNNNLSANIDFLEKIEFNSENEYYNYYLGIEDIEISNSIKESIVYEYIKGIEWCAQYYFNECISWCWGYNLLTSPLIKDIVIFFPSQINIEKTIRCLNPV